MGTEFFLDLQCIEFLRGVKPVCGTIKKHSPLLLNEMPWEEDLEFMCSLIREEQKYRIYYWASRCVGKSVIEGIEATEQTDKGIRKFLCMAESEDGLNWTRPNLGLVDFEGSRDNNMIIETSTGDSVFYNIIKDDDDPDPMKRYKAIGFDRAQTSILKDFGPGSNGVCIAYSSDGIHWPEGPKLVLSTRDLTDADCLLPRRDPVSGNWILFARPRTTPKRRFIGYSESCDFEHWTYPRMLLTPDSGDCEWTEFYGLTAAVVDSWRIGALWVFHNNPLYSPMTCELVFSRDGYNYNRSAPGSQLITLGQSGSFDSRMILPVAVLPLKDKVIIYYSGSNREHGSDRSNVPLTEMKVEEGQQYKAGLGAAEIPGRNFRGYKAEFDGMVETTYICNYGKKGLSIYADIEDNGRIQVEIADQHGKILPGFESERSELQKQPDNSYKVFWEGGVSGAYYDKSPHGGRVLHVVKLRFFLHKAAFFGFSIGEDSSYPAYNISAVE